MITLLSFIRRAAILAAAAIVVLSLTSCAEGNYPSIGNITKISDSSILTPEQRAAAVKELEKERDTHGEQAAKEIEKPR